MGADHSRAESQTSVVSIFLRELSIWTELIGIKEQSNQINTPTCKQRLTTHLWDSCKEDLGIHSTIVNENLETFVTSISVKCQTYNQCESMSPRLANSLDTIEQVTDSPLKDVLHGCKLGVFCWHGACLSVLG